MILGFFALFFVSLLCQILVLSFSRKFNVGIDLPEKSNRSKHKTHSLSVPRTGGVGIFISFWVAVAFLDFDFRLVLLFSSCFIVGFVEDINKNLNSSLRLYLIAVISASSLLVFDRALLTDIGVFFPVWFAVPFTVFAFSGLTNAINIVDGMHGLSSGIVLLALFFLGYSAFCYGDAFLVGALFYSFAIVLGFFVLNFPRGWTFLGDGGAYLLGFLSALLATLLINRNPQISPWYPVVIFLYPITDTLFSIYRRRFVSHRNAMAADKLHLHILVKKRLFRNSPYSTLLILGHIFIIDVIAVLMKNSTAGLILLFILGNILYVYVYEHLVRFKARNIFKKQLNSI